MSTCDYCGGPLPTFPGRPETRMRTYWLFDWANSVTRMFCGEECCKEWQLGPRYTITDKGREMLKGRE